MQKSDPLGILRLLVVCCAGMVSAHALWAATPTFTVSATNVTMPANGGNGSSQIALTSVNGYSGRLTVNSQYSGGDMNAKPPNGGSGGGTAPFYTLNANSTAKGTLTFFPYGKIVPIARLHRPAHVPNTAPVLGLAIAGWLVFRRRRRMGAARWFAILVLGAITIAGAAACGGAGLSGVYPFTVTATDTVTNTAANTQIMVTVP